MTEAPEGDVPRGLVRSSGVMAAGTVVSRALGFARNTVLAAAIGTDLAQQKLTLPVIHSASSLAR